MTARLREHYDTVVRKALQEKFAYANHMELPRLSKITINMGVGAAAQDRKKIEGAIADMTAISGQKPILTKAKKSIAGFKLRDGMVVGCKVTLRRERMYEFLDRLVTIALPRVRDFRGIPTTGFDGQGNYNMGLKEQIIFPEIEYDQVDVVRGMDISFNTTAKTDEECRALLEGFDMPFIK
ncbi:LSU ribosomal protein L5p (L11e) [Caenispirillum salinarum AK4]|uniref:Large ribosomal subunit protein uL5 n=1 Tax=Caenispirillum salinarum AK4 TaxID=1238182 RepID=K9GVQ2_9PROT|nr:50S ribosomal protein L5 [Caenispirillum salinarum]EKV29297.1 LSU ribosomal protein L5p (L11e) [Caenispirillum salinarum AK4]